jgi:hypothetical protein
MDTATAQKTMIIVAIGAAVFGSECHRWISLAKLGGSAASADSASAVAAAISCVQK